MKVRRIPLLSLVLLIFIAASVYAHPGRTDGNGGHTNHSTGEYHYHHGYSEHQHYDKDGDGIADCPYDFKDNTVHNNSSSSSSPSSFSDEYYRIMQEETEELGYWERKLIELEEEQRQNREAVERKKIDEIGKVDDIATDKCDNDKSDEDNSKITFKDVLQMLLSAPLFSYLALLTLAFVLWIVESTAKTLANKKINFPDRFIRGLLVVSAIIGFCMSSYIFL